MRSTEFHSSLRIWKTVYSMSYNQALQSSLERTISVTISTAVVVLNQGNDRHSNVHE